MDEMIHDAVRSNGLLTANDPHPVSVINRSGGSRIVMTCEHASNRLPENLGTLGLSTKDLLRHIAWDIGAAATAQRVATIIDAPLVTQQFSRLVIDCNRPKNCAESISLVSDGIRIIGNERLAPADREARYQEIHRPFHRAIEVLLDERSQGDMPSPVIVALHSFTPVLAEQQRRRSWDLGLLYHRDDRLAIGFEHALENIGHNFSVAHNQPYSVNDETDYTLPVHGERRGIQHLLLEIRNNHLSDSRGILSWSTFLAKVLRELELNL